MGDFPDPDEEYELMYSDDLELIREIDDGTDSKIVKNKVLPAKRSLDFSSPVQKPQLNNKQNSVNESILSESSQSPSEIISTIPTKRTAEDLFGDINDIDFDDLGLPSKRQKTEEENDLELINKIIEGRKMRQMLSEPNRALLENMPYYSVSKNLSLKIPKWAFMPFTNWDGDRVYVRMESEDSWEDSLDLAPDQISLKSMFTPVWEEARKILEAKRNRIENDSVQETTDDKQDFTDLWVEKYKPKSYIDLLSEEPVNRCLLHWLHLWDKIVFNKDLKSVEPQQRNSFSKRTGQFQLSNKWRNKKDEPEMDEDGRPHHKVALVCGPPGVGKTTLAHLLARLAGYRPVELNASDERSTDQFKNALQSATLMRSVLDAEKRPNCLILDEIDGAPIQTVELLVRWCMAKRDEGKKKSRVHVLKRPVIAICNDLYATSLRPLRPISLIVTVGAVCSTRLSSRLNLVAKCERVHVAARALTALAARARGDVRSALHALSFLRAGGRNGDQIKVEDVENIAIGTKDNSQSVMQALQTVFTLNNNDHEAVLKVIQAAGEYERIADGIFENYPCSRSDSRLLVSCAISELLALFDITSSWILRTSNYSMYGVLPSLLARCHGILATRQPPRVKFPLTSQEMSRKKTELDSIQWSIWRGSSVYNTKKSLKLDIVPLLPYILSPMLRSANIQLCSDSERKSVLSCAGAMCDYGLTYIQRREQAGYEHVIEPDLYRLALFGPEDRMRPSPAVRQAIAAQQQLEVIRRNEDMMNRTSGRTEEKCERRAPKKEVSVVGVKESRLPNHLQRLQPKAIERALPQVQKDFFGRIVQVAEVQKQDGVSDVITSAVFYQYREGFNNAVRRNVRVRDLM